MIWVAALKWSWPERRAPGLSALASVWLRYAEFAVFIYKQCAHLSQDVCSLSCSRH